MKKIQASQPFVSAVDEDSDPGVRLNSLANLSATKDTGTKTLPRLFVLGATRTFAEFDKWICSLVLCRSGWS